MLNLADEALRLAPDYIPAQGNKGITLRLLGEVLATRSYQVEDGEAYANVVEAADQAYADASEAFSKVLSLAPSDTFAYINKGNTLMSRGNLLGFLARQVEDGEAYADVVERAQQFYADAVEAFNEALRLAPNHIHAHYNKAQALLSWELCMRSVRHDEAARTRWKAAQAHAEHILALERVSKLLFWPFARPLQTPPNGQYSLNSVCFPLALSVPYRGFETRSKNLLPIRGFLSSND